MVCPITQGDHKKAIKTVECIPKNKTGNNVCQHHMLEAERKLTTYSHYSQCILHEGYGKFLTAFITQD